MCCGPPPTEHMCVLRVLTRACGGGGGGGGGGRIQLVGQLYPDRGDQAWRRLLPATDFQNPALSRKLEEQLLDTMAVAAVALPSWCRKMLHGAPFLFARHLRERYVHATAFGPSRAVVSVPGAWNGAASRALLRDSGATARQPGTAFASLATALGAPMSRGAANGAHASVEQPSSRRIATDLIRCKCVLGEFNSSRRRQMQQISDLSRRAFCFFVLFILFVF